MPQFDFRSPRVFVEAPLTAGASVELDRNQSNYLGNVMRLAAGATILAFGYVFPMIYLVYSLWFGARAPDNPWNARGLEWMTTSPPPLHNFHKPPIVDFEAYAYANKVPERD